MSTRFIILILWAFDFLFLTGAYLHDLMGSPSYTFEQLFGLDREFSIPTAYSGLKFTLLSLLTALLAFALNRPYGRYVLLGLAALFMLMAVDELGGLHERIALLIRHFFLQEDTVTTAAKSGVALHGLIATLPMAGLLVALVMMLKPAWTPLHGGLGMFAAGLAVFLAGALVFDSLLGGLIGQKASRVVLEEGLEFVGVTIMITALITTISRNPLQITIGSKVVVSPIETGVPISTDSVNAGVSWHPDGHHPTADKRA